MSNILLYSGPGVSTTALAHTKRALQELCPSYDVRPTSAQELATAPWQHTASLVVIPGGRDLPYVQEFARPWPLPSSSASSSSSSQQSASSSRTHTAEAALRTWIRESGGAFLGICAGAYFASSHCAFEEGTPMQVVGPRPALKLFPGECRGAVYPGFVYESDAGARVVRLQLPGEGAGEGSQSQSRQEPLAMHYNGGGAFPDAQRYADEGVRVLAAYPAEDDEIASTGAGQAAVVHCKAGNGQAILFGTHPEFSLLPGSRPVRLSSAPHTIDVDEEVLVEEDTRRRLFLADCLAMLGLRVQRPSQPGEGPSQQLSSQELATAGKLSPLILCGGAEQVQTCLAALSEVKAADDPALAVLPAPDDSLRPYKNDAGSPHCLSLQDSNDLFHIYRGDTATAQAVVQLCDSAPYDAFTVPDAESGGSGEIDLHKVPKYMLAYDAAAGVPACRHWDTAAFLSALETCRSRVPSVPTPRQRLAGVVQYGERVTSTQTLLHRNPKLLERLPSGFVSFATHQIAGRGRGGNAWISPLGCLQFSLLLHVAQEQQGLGATAAEIGPKLVFVQYLAGLAIVYAIREGLGAAYAPVGRKVRLKWPNDIYAEVSSDAGGQRKGTFRHLDKTWAKMGGVLVNSQFSRGRWSLVVGCGVNCLNALPTVSLSALIDEYNEGAQTQAQAQSGTEKHLPHVSQEDLAAAALAQFERLWGEFVAAGGSWTPFVQRYRAAWLHSDQDTTLTTVRPPLRIRILGISSDSGMLRALPLGPVGERPAEAATAAASQPKGAFWSSSSLQTQAQSYAQPYAAPLFSSDDTAQAWGDAAMGRAIGALELQPDGNSFDMLENLIRVKV